MYVNNTSSEVIYHMKKLKICCRIACIDMLHVTGVHMGPGLLY